MDSVAASGHVVCTGSCSLGLDINAGRSSAGEEKDRSREQGEAVHTLRPLGSFVNEAGFKLNHKDRDM